MAIYKNHHLRLRVAKACPAGASILRLTLRDQDGWPLPPFSPGAHLDVLTDAGIRQYSILSDAQDDTQYEIGVLRESGGRGGSRWIHDGLAVGDEVLASLPRNHFALDLAFERHVLIAGGIGVTPILSMLPELRRAGKHVTLHYCVRTLEQAVFLDDIRQWVPPQNIHVYVDGGDPSRGIQLASALAGLGETSIVYCCGPHGLMDAVAAATAHWDPARVRMERFKGAMPSTANDPAFSVRLASTGRTIAVPAGLSILQALRTHDIDVPASCEAGICGSCRTRHSGGTVVHKDLILNAEQRKTEMLICVSRCTSDLLTLEL